MSDPLQTIPILQMMLSVMTRSGITLLNHEIELLISNCQKTLNQVHKLSRTLTRNVQKHLNQWNYHKLPQIIETYMSAYPGGMIAQQAVVVIKKIIPYSNGELLKYIIDKCEILQMKTPNYHEITLWILPHIKVYTDLIQHTSGIT